MPNNNKTKKVGYSEKTTMPPLGIISIGSYLKMHGYEVDYLDLFACSMKKSEFLNYVSDFNPDIIGISSYTENFNVVIKLTELIKNAFPKIIIILGGPHVTFCPDEALEHSTVDFVSRGEGEMTFVELLEALNYNTLKLEEIDGLSFRNKNGDIVHTNNRKFIVKLDSLPWGDMNLKKKEIYNIKQLIITSRGCPGRCIYCASSALSGNKYRMRSAENVFSEIYYKYKYKGERYFAFLDDTFTANRNRLNQFCELIKKHKLDIVWRCDSRTDILSYEMIDNMYDAGCTSVHIGIESGSQEVINKINKNISLQKSEDLLAYMSNKGMQVMCSFIIGHHCDTKDTIRLTIDLARKFKNNYGAVVGIGVNTPFPGTTLYEERDKLGVKLESTNWSTYDLVQPVISTKYLTREELQEIFYEMQELM
ncbi:cobalamin B12-binding domain-containing protein [Ruminiclostridium herbifermentans]|uniref:Cobalamin B12-binding domain-containing protein n=1 Tax=Ruminiclostridium herbifermentans TaxID=2488810 RepID=A0A4U7JI85_9FIRM|nr:radical SAM protein [Ruminiclostridium herbifermentans]QNU67042.1 cobalamin B12-binding domain-containing protein [Ruminiclostridium herbifermentans]